MPIIPFNDFAPDAPDFRNPGSPLIRNAIPLRGAYGPWPQLVPFTSALDNRARGAIEAFDKDGNAHQYAGDTGKIYELDSNLDWQDISKSGGYSTANRENWEFVRWSNRVLGTNYSDNPQSIDMAGGSASDLTTAFRAKTIAAVRDFIVVGNTVDSSDGSVIDRVRWSAINNPDDWTVSASTLSDFRDLGVGGGIQRIVGGEIGVILSERSIFRMLFVGEPSVFQIEEVLSDIGPVAPGGVAVIGSTIYVMSYRGFVAMDSGGGRQHIGAGRVDQWMLKQLDSDNKHRITSVADPDTNRVLWAFPGDNSQGGLPNKILLYDANFDKWAYAEEEVELLNRAQGVSVSLDDLPSIGFTNLDTMNISLDSRFFKDFTAHNAAFNPSHEMGVFRGIGKAATLVTTESELTRGRRSMVNYVRPLVDGASPTVSVGTRDELSEVAQFGPSRSPQISGRVSVRANARFHRFKVDIPEGTWYNTEGIQVDQSGVKRASRR